MILIIGATSSIGKNVIPMLLESNLSLRLASRTPEKLKEFAGENVELVQADLLDTDSIKQVCQGVDQIFITVASMLGRGASAAKHVDLVGHRNLIDIAKASGVQHIVYMSTQEATHDNPVPFFRYKAQTEDYLRASGLTYTILRASAFFEPHASLIGASVLKGGAAIIMGQGDNPRNFIANSDVAHFAYLALTDTQMHNQTIDIGGPQNLTSRQVAEIYATVAGADLKVRTIPRFVPKIMSHLMKPFHPGISDVLAAVVDADTRDKTFESSPTLSVYPVPLTTLEEWVREQAIK